jgi:glycosyltransferase involved in cell wall biosynthesis
LADATLAYSATEARELTQLTPGANVVAVPNALYSRASIQSATADESGSAFVFVGRLVPTKKPELLIEAFAEARRRLPSDAHLILVGDGPLRQELEARAVTLGVQGQVSFRGHVNDWQELQRIYRQALASVSPGYVGLSLIQSLSFGIPMIIARDEPHSPEIEAASEGRNALLFESDDKGSLGAAMREAWQRREFWRDQRRSIAQACARQYSIDTMVDQILLVLNTVTGAGLGADNLRKSE